MQTRKCLCNWDAQETYLRYDRLRLVPWNAPAVLVVEDDEDIAELLAYSLKKRGFAVAVAHDGVSAFELVKELRPELILLDVLLPRLDGREVCRLIRTNPDKGLAKTPIIMLSALTMPEDIENGLALGANAYFPKPYSVRDVVAAVSEWLLPGKGE